MNTNRTARIAAALLASTLTLAASEASGQTEPASTAFQVERFEPMPAQGINILNLASSDVVGHSQPTAGVFLHFVDSPLVLRDPEIDDPEIESRLVDNQLKAEVWAGVGLHDRFDIGFVAPFILTQSGAELENFASSVSAVDGAALSDLRIVPKAMLIKPEQAFGLGVSFVPTLFLPTGDRDTFNSDGNLKFEPRLAVDWRSESDIKVGANFAYLFRPRQFANNYVSDDVLRWGVGVHAPFPFEPVEELAVVASLFGDIQLTENRDPLNLDESVRDNLGTPIEFDGGLQYSLPYNLVVNAGAGTGLTDGVGSPVFRIFASVGYTPRIKDSDGDGLYDDEDECPTDPEDPDGFEDQDGCPDHDNDEDSILDVDDECPNDPEDLDGFEDENGCPDPDNDGDGVLDVDDECPDTPGLPERAGCPEKDRDGDGILDEEDQCPDDPEDKDGFQDADGCPDHDNDGDGLLDAEDKCPLEPEDKDNFQDDDGCPDPDNDGDGIPDVDDKCPLQPETMNGVDDEDGCPEDTKVRITKTKIEILEKVYFDTNKATIKPRSYGLLDEIAQVLKQNAQISKLRVEGHTDSRGSEKYNQDLSERRAASVRQHLVEKGGISADRLVSKGFGESQPIADNSKKAGRDQNRRVEFLILEIDGKPVGSKSAVIEKEEEVMEEAEPKKEEATDDSGAEEGAGEESDTDDGGSTDEGEQSGENAPEEKKADEKAEEKPKSETED
jgi:outer membrane protein OmpA-like peptidoglycan-associated protein